MCGPPAHPAGHESAGAPYVRQAVSPMDQDPECRPPPGSGGGGDAGGDHDITRHQALQQRLPATFEVGRFHRHPDDAPSLNPGPVEPALHYGLERRRPAPRFRCGLEAQDVHLPVALLPIEETAGSVQAGQGVRAQEHFGQGVHQAARKRTHRAGGSLSRRARRSALRRNRRSRTTR